MPGPYYAKAITATENNVLGINNATDKEIILVPKNSGTIDVINDFIWTASPQIATFKKVPVLYLTERKQELNSLLASAMYYLNALEQNTGTVGRTVRSAADAVITKVVSLLPGAETNVNNGDTQYQYFASKYAGSTDDKSLLKDLKSYIGIYYTKVTGFEYALPYFNNSGLNTSNNWGETAQTRTPLVTDIMESIANAAETVSSTLNINQPGTFIEKPKYYQYDASGKSVTVTFPLFNTITRGTGSTSQDKLPYQQNYELLWILAYQNRPFRTSFSRVSPAKMYTLSIPGQEFFPYCYIESLSIDFKGTRRNLPVTIPSASDNIPIITSIPEAYMVTITFRSLLANVSNMMINTGFTDNKVRASSK